MDLTPFFVETWQQRAGSGWDRFGSNFGLRFASSRPGCGFSWSRSGLAWGCGWRRHWAYGEFQAYRCHQLPDCLKARFRSAFKHFIKAFPVDPSLLGDFIYANSFCNLTQRMNQRRVTCLHTFSNISRHYFRAVEEAGSFVTTCARSVEIEDRHILGIECRFAHVIYPSWHRGSV